MLKGGLEIQLRNELTTIEPLAEEEQSPVVSGEHTFAEKSNVVVQNQKV